MTAIPLQASLPLVDNQVIVDLARKLSLIVKVYQSCFAAIWSAVTCHRFGSAMRRKNVETRGHHSG
jgi:hypothetical protein